MIRRPTCPRSAAERRGVRPRGRSHPRLTIPAPPRRLSPMTSLGSSSGRFRERRRRAGDDRRSNDAPVHARRAEHAPRVLAQQRVESRDPSGAPDRAGARRPRDADRVRRQAGRHAGGPAAGGEARDAAQAAWLAARDAAVEPRVSSTALGVHKQVANRLLEPFMWHTVIVTATDWDGFWLQRCSPLAQPEIRVVADAMRAAFDASDPVRSRIRRLAPSVHPRRRSQRSDRRRRAAEDLGRALRPGLVPQPRGPTRPRR